MRAGSWRRTATRPPWKAAQKAAAFEKAGDKEQAETWRRVEAALMQMRGARQG
jgi:hypothetical protein